MLNGFRDYLNPMLRVGSFGSKVFAFGATAFGLRRLWSEETAELSVPAKVGLSSAYVVHMGAAFLATSAFFSDGPLNAGQITALLGVTSLLLNYANVIENRATSLVMDIRRRRLEKELAANKLDTRRSLDLIEGIDESANLLKFLAEENTYLQAALADLAAMETLSPSTKTERLQALYKTLDEKYQEQRRRGEIIEAYFKKPGTFDLNVALAEVNEKLTQLRADADQLKEKIRNTLAVETQERLKGKLGRFEEELARWGIINVQCIKYKKIANTIREFRSLAASIDQGAQADRQYLEGRIGSMERSLAELRKPLIVAPELDTGMVTLAHDQAREDPEAFRKWLQVQLQSHVTRIEAKIKEHETHVSMLRRAFRLFVKNPAQKVEDNYDHISEVTRALVAVQNKQAVGRLSSKGNKVRLNFSAISSLLAMLFYLIPPSADAVSILKPFMISIGLIAGASSLWFFQKKYFFSKKTEAQGQQKLLRNAKEIEFNRNAGLQRALSAEIIATVPKKSASQSIAVEKTLPARASRQRASQAITHMFVGKRKKTLSVTTSEKTKKKAKPRLNER